MIESHDKKQAFMVNVSIIFLAQVMVKVLGAVYRLVITNFSGFGDAGNGFYGAGFSLYTLLLAISSVGIPNAISKMVSERTALGDYRGAHKIFKTAFVLFSAIGLIFSAALFFGADFIAYKVLKFPGAEYTLKALAPSILFVCISSVISGYFLGMQYAKATGTWQVVEQFFKCTLTILFVYFLIGQKSEIMAAGANFATSVATMISFGYLFVFYACKKKGIWAKVRSATVQPEDKSVGKTMLSILMISIPISLGSIITAIARNIDTMTITRGINVAFRAGIPGIAGTPTDAMITKEAIRLAGMLSKSDTLTNLPLALNIAFSTVLVPSITSALAVGNKKEAANKVEFSFLISILIILPCVVGMVVLADPIYKLLYPNASQGAYLLQLSAIALIFSALDQTIFGSLQGMGKIFVPAKALLIGVLVKVVLNIALIRIPWINISGAAISSIICHLIAFLIAFSALRKNLKINLPKGKYIIKPALANLAMAITAICIYKLLMLIVPSNALATLVAIAFAVAVYCITLVALRILNKDEIEMLPMGANLSNFLQKRGLI